MVKIGSGYDRSAYYFLEKSNEKMSKLKETLQDGWLPSDEEMMEEGKMDHIKAREELDNYINATFTPKMKKETLGGRPIFIPDDDRHYRNEEYAEVERENSTPSWDRNNG